MLKIIEIDRNTEKIPENKTKKKFLSKQSPNFREKFSQHTKISMTYVTN